MKSRMLSIGRFVSMFGAAALLGGTARADDSNPECTAGLCGSPQQNGGGGGGGGGGSVLYNYTDDGRTYSYSDDADQDGVEDDFDNCPFAANRDQADQDGDGVGDVCDNCRAQANADQLDTNGNRLGDGCDPDMDADGVPNSTDNCPKVPNADQVDTNGNGLGDACDPDIDADGVPNAADNCPSIYNPQQLATDPATFAAAGQACTVDSDSDGIANDLDTCAYVSDPAQKDTDGDGVGDACSPDIDGDRILNADDDCPAVANADQKDADNDGLGDACDPHFCLVLDRAHPEACLDPVLTFEVGASTETTAKVGERLRLPLFANRQNAVIRYSWTVVERPTGSSATVDHAVGSVSTSGKGYEYSYTADPPRWSPDVAGTWRLRLHAELVHDDALYPGDTVADHDLTVKVAEKAGAQGCSQAGPASFLALLLAGLLRRRRA